MLSESPQVPKQSDAFANPFLPFLMSFWARLTTLIGDEVLYCLDIYVGAIIMTLGVLGSHLVI